MTHRSQPNDGSNSQRIEFRLDSNLIHHLVDHQAATPEKALLELVMNSADAGATRIELTFSEDGFVIVDNGKGFSTEDEIRTFFATFGTPQEREKTYGRYRVGRAQIFGWATTSWESNSFRMLVDIANDSHGFTLQTLSPQQSGCRIQGRWNDKVAPQGQSQMQQMVRNLEQALLFPAAEIWINGNLIAKPAHEQEWTSETDFAFFRLGTHGPIRLFNQGVFVCEFPHSDFHVGGVVLTKTAIELTMARNEPLQYTWRWMQIAQHLQAQANTLYEDGGAVGTDEFRAYAMRRAFEKKGDIDVACITTIPKKHITLRECIAEIRKTYCVVYASRGDVAKVESAIQSGRITAAALHFDSLERIRSTLSIPYTHDDAYVVIQFLNAVEPIARAAGLSIGKTAIYSAASIPPDKQFSDVTPWEEMSWEERNFINAVTEPLDTLANIVGNDEREFHLADTDGDTIAYTDGEEIVVFSRAFVEKVLSNRRGAATLEFVLTYVHELCHDGDSRNAGHDDVFYTAYHNCTMKHAREIETAVKGVQRAAGQARPVRAIETKNLPTISNAWYEPGSRFMTDGERLHHTRSVISNAIKSLQRGETNVEDLKKSFDNTAQRFAHYREFTENECDIAEPLLLRGPVLWLNHHAPFNCLPTKELLTTFQDEAWNIVRFTLPEVVSGKRAVKMHVGRHPAGTICIQKRGIEWKPHKSIPDEFEELFSDLCTRFASGFPWSERSTERDLAWTMIAKITLAQWAGGRRTWSDRESDTSIQIRRRSDPTASYINLTSFKNHSTWNTEALTDDWKASLFKDYPDLVFCTEQQLVNEGLDAFAADALAVVSQPDALRFWMKWSGSK